MRQWWRDAVIYQVYLRSFADSTGDGIGDLGGLRRKLRHLVDLGVDGLWLNPCYPSPQHDHGYDVADYRDIEPAYGNLDEHARLLDEAHDAGLRVLMDLVPNHCSTDHPWFQAALKAAPGSPERERFLFREGNGDLPPNSWKSSFGGPAWTRVPDGQWYLNLFDSSQADFNWRNPEVAEMFDDVVRFWFDRGIDGFRIDVPDSMIKQKDFRDHDGSRRVNPYTHGQPELHDIYRRWRRIAESYDQTRELSFVGEIWTGDMDHLAASLTDDELHQAFYFDLLLQPWDATDVRRSLENANGVLRAGRSLAWVLNNHDVWRTPSRYGGGELGLRRAHAAALLMLALPGTAYVYQGEELGLPEVVDLPDQARQDPRWIRSGGTDLGRDGCRVPLPWTPDPPTFGFSTAKSSWLPQPDWFGAYAAAGNPTLRIYRAALAARRTVFPAGGEIAFLETGRDDVLAFRRGNAVSVTVFGGDAYELPAEWGSVVAASAEVTGAVPAATTVWLSAA
ncbi:alpha-amylase family glycosyl hydrolase [Fodinicola acaciae]|uniref:alpha-amylase family glycosyl hydrolase n=1 Tax=Fodinicola acaciae TaxID=2681555 RepID=UPI001FE26D16|nr:alpha-amylase family glycosyl hydrolase [Fodinicola acaciae]